MQRPDINLDAVDADGCTPIWAAAYNGEYHCALWILSKGPNLELRGKASNTASCTPCNAARSQRNPTIADAIDAELELRRQDPKRVASLKSGNIDYEDFREDLRSTSARIGNGTLELSRDQSLLGHGDDPRPAAGRLPRSNAVRTRSPARPGSRRPVWSDPETRATGRLATASTAS